MRRPRVRLIAALARSAVGPALGQVKPDVVLRPDELRGGGKARGTTRVVRRSLSLCAVGLVLLSGAPLGNAHAQPAESEGAAPVLRHVGRWLVDVQGRVVILHGTNMVNKLAPYYPAALGFDEGDLQFLADHGVNSIRLGWNWQGLEPTIGVYDEAYLDQIVADVHRAERYGMVPVLEFHQDFVHPKFIGGQGFPDWAVASSPEGLVGLGAFMDAFMNNQPVGGVGLQDRLAAAWQHIARRLSDDRHVVFELINEPVPAAPLDLAQCLVPLGCPLSDRTRLAALNRRMLDGIRAVDANRLVYVEPWVTFDFGIRTWLPPTGDPNVGFSFHVYCLTGAASPIAPPPPLSGVACPELFGIGMANGAAHESETGEPMLLTEFGAGGSEAHHVAVVDLADQAMIGWHHWAYFAQDMGEAREYALLRDISQGPVPGNVREDQLRALTRPYPKAIAGTPQRFGFDPRTGVFHLDYTTNRVDGSGAFVAGTHTVLAVPPLPYPDGYAVQVTGARIESASGSGELVLASCPDATSVHVVVTARGIHHSDCPLASPSPGIPDSDAASPSSRPLGTLPATGPQGMIWTAVALVVGALGMRCTTRRFASS